MSLIEVQNVTKIFGPRPKQALERYRAGLSKEELLAETGHTLGLADVSLSINKGEIFVVMGLSGSGKSTLIRHFNRLIEPTDGQILVNGDDVLEAIDQRPAGVPAHHHEHGVPALWPDAAPHRPAERRLRARRAGHLEEGAPGAGDALGRDRRPRRLRAPVPDAAVRRDAAARRPCPCARDRRRDPADGRGILRARPADPQPDAGPADRAPGRARQDHRLHHPRPRRGAQDRRPDRDPEGRQAQPGRQARRNPPPPGGRLRRLVRARREPRPRPHRRNRDEAADRAPHQRQPGAGACRNAPGRFAVRLRGRQRRLPRHRPAGPRGGGDQRQGRGRPLQCHRDRPDADRRRRARIRAPHGAGHRLSAARGGRKRRVDGRRVQPGDVERAVAAEGRARRQRGHAGARGGPGRHRRMASRPRSPPADPAAANAAPAASPGAANRQFSAAAPVAAPRQTSQHDPPSRLCLLRRRARQLSLARAVGLQHRRRVLRPLGKARPRPARADPRRRYRRPAPAHLRRAPGRGQPLRQRARRPRRQARHRGRDPPRADAGNRRGPPRGLQARRDRGAARGRLRPRGDRLPDGNLGRHAPRHGRSRQPDAGPRGGDPSGPRPRPEPARSDGGGVQRGGDGRHRSRRSGDDDLHLGHHGPAEGRAPRPPRSARPHPRRADAPRPDATCRRQAVDPGGLGVGRRPSQRPPARPCDGGRRGGAAPAEVRPGRGAGLGADRGRSQRLHPADGAAG